MSANYNLYMDRQLTELMLVQLERIAGALAGRASNPALADTTYVWCEHEGDIHRSGENRCTSGHYHLRSFDGCPGPCPGPHYVLIVGHKTTAQTPAPTDPDMVAKALTREE
jgi:hypothetical protein